MERRTKRCEDRPSRPDQVPGTTPAPVTSSVKEMEVTGDPIPKESTDPSGDMGQRDESGTTVIEVGIFC